MTVTAADVPTIALQRVVCPHCRTPLFATDATVSPTPGVPSSLIQTRCRNRRCARFVEVRIALPAAVVASGKQRNPMGR